MYTYHLKSILVFVKHSPDDDFFVGGGGGERNCVSPVKHIFILKWTLNYTPEWTICWKLMRECVIIVKAFLYERNRKHYETTLKRSDYMPKWKLW